MKHEKISGALTAAAAGLAMAALLSRADAAADGARAGLSLCARLVLPSLFPFMALSVFICESRAAEFLGRLLAPVTRFLRLPECCGVILLSAAVGGYPSAAKCISSAVSAGRLDASSAARMLSFCVNAGPPFLVAAVGVGVFGSAEVGAVLLASQLLSAAAIAAVGALFAQRPCRAPASHREYPPAAACLTDSVITAAGAAFDMCACIVIFSAAAELFRSFGLFPSFASPLAGALLTGAVEVTSGCAKCGALSGFSGIAAAAALCSFSGVSVMFQIAGAVAGNGVRLRPFLLSRPVHAALTALLCRLLLGLFPRAVQSFAASGSGAQASLSVSAPAAVSLLCMLSLFMLSLVPKNSKFSMENERDI